MASLNSKFWSIRSHSWVGLSLLLGFVGLTGCGRSVDPKITEKALKEELAKQGVGSVKEVSCPSGMAPGQKFDCTGIFESGIGFRIPVEQKNEGDKLVWEIPSIKGMLNMNQVMKTMQGELKLGDGAIDCGTASTYRMVTLGSTFECTFVSTANPGSDGKDSKEAKNPSAKSMDQAGDLPAVKNADEATKKPDLTGPNSKKSAKKEPDKIEIAIASSGDVTWQRMIEGLATGPTAKPNSSNKMSEAQSETSAADKAKNSKPKSSNSKAPVVEEVPYDS